MGETFIYYTKQPSFLEKKLLWYFAIGNLFFSSCYIPKQIECIFLLALNIRQLNRKQRVIDILVDKKTIMFTFFIVQLQAS